MGAASQQSMMASPSSRFFSTFRVAKSSLAVRMTPSKYGAISVPGNSNPRISYSEIKSCTAANSARPRGFAAQLRAKTLDVITTEDVLRVLRPIWTDKAETASCLRGRIEQVLEPQVRRQPGRMEGKPETPSWAAWSDGRENSCRA